MRSPRKCRILFVIHHMGVGGAQKQLARTVNLLDRERFQSDVVCITRGGANLDSISDVHGKYILGAAKVYDARGLAATLRLSAIIRSGAYDIVEAYLPAAHLLCALALCGSKHTALIASRRNLASLDPTWFARLAPLLNRATWLSIANSRSVKRSVIERYDLNPSKVFLLPNIAERAVASFSRADARSRLGLGDGQYAVAAAATFSPVKDYPTIIRAFAGLRRSGREAVLLLAGEGGCLGECAALARSLDLNGEVRFLGSVKEVASVLAAADAFVHASRSEGMSNSVLEAMSAGLPIVASDIPANREALGREGAFFFSPGDWRGCLQGLVTFADDTAVAVDTGMSARRRAIRLFDGKRTMRRRERLYLRIQDAINAFDKP